MFSSVRSFLNEIAANIRAFVRFSTKKEDHKASQAFVSADHDSVMAEPDVRTSNLWAQKLWPQHRDDRHVSFDRLDRRARYSNVRDRL